MTQLPNPETYTEKVTPLPTIGREPLELNRLVAAVSGGAGTDGAIVTFLGLVRNHNLGRPVVAVRIQSRRWLSFFR